MKIVSDNKQYEQALKIAEKYLGDDGELFLRTHIVTHLGIKPEELKSNHIPTLTNWTRLAFALISNNPETVKHFADELGLLSQQD